METSRAETGSSAMMNFGLKASAPGDADALPLTARELVGEAVDVALVEAHLVKQGKDRRPPVIEVVGDQRLGDDVAHAQPGIE